jgi:hypothetical protein
MSQKRLFTDELVASFTDEGDALAKEATEALKPIMERWIQAGYNRLEVAYIIASTIDFELLVAARRHARDIDPGYDVTG